MDKKRCLLIVDDALFMRKKLKDLLQKGLGIEAECIDEAEDGWEALHKYKEKRHEIVITDINMPGLTGIEVVKEIKDINNKAIIVIVTVSEKESMKQAAMAAGAHDYIVKPSEGKQIVSVIEKILLDLAR